jgi:hypothetical protein
MFWSYLYLWVCDVVLYPASVFIIRQGREVTLSQWTCYEYAWTHMDPQSRDPISPTHDQELHLIKETSPSIKKTRNDGSSMDDIIPYLHHRSAVRFSSLHDQKCCAPLILLMEVLCTSSYHSLSAYRIRSCCWINCYPLSLMDIRDTARPQPSY